MSRTLLPIGRQRVLFIADMSAANHARRKILAWYTFHVEQLGSEKVYASRAIGSLLPAWSASQSPCHREAL